MKRYTLALGANTPVAVQVMGEFFLLDAAPLGGVKVEFFGPSGMRRDELIEDGLESMYARLEHGFTSLKITSTLAQSVSFYVARGALGVNRFSGSSDVTDRAARLLGTLTAWIGKNRLYSPGYLSGTAVGAVASQSSFSRLLNPVASGLRLFVDRVHISASAAGTFDFRSGVTLGVLNPAPFKKDSTLAAAVGQVYTGAAAAVGGTAQDAWQVAAADGGGGARTFEEPIILRPGESIAVVDITVNESIRAGWEWREGV